MGQESEYSAVDGAPVVHVVAGLIDSDPASLPPETATCTSDSLHLAKVDSMTTQEENLFGFSCFDGCDGQLPRTIFYLFFHLF